jgi:ComF family protein
MRSPWGWPSRGLGTLLRGAVSILYPARCLVCARDLADAGEFPPILWGRERGEGRRPRGGGRLGEFLCLRCAGLEPLAGGAMRGGRAPARVALFRTGPGALALLHALKYGGCRPIARTLGEMAAGALERDLPGGPATVWIPVPLHASRRRERGFNQSELLAGALAERLGGRVVPHALHRVRDTPSQARLDRDRRLSNVRGAFALGGASLGCRERPVVLVDDVVTTGATAREAARTLELLCPPRLQVLSVASGLDPRAPSGELCLDSPERRNL